MLDVCSVRFRGLTENTTNRQLPHGLRVQASAVVQDGRFGVALVLREGPVFGACGCYGTVGRAVQAEGGLSLVGEEAVGGAGEAEGGGRAAEEGAVEEEGHFGGWTCGLFARGGVCREGLKGSYMYLFCTLEDIWSHWKGGSWSVTSCYTLAAAREVIEIGLRRTSLLQSVHYEHMCIDPMSRDLGMRPARI